MQRQVKVEFDANPPEQVKRLLSKADLRMIFLKGVHSECFVPPHMVVPRETQTLISTAAEFLRSGDVLVVLSRLNLVGKTKKGNGKIFEFKQELGLVFGCECDSFNDQGLKLFAEANGTYIAWPYHRELLHSTMSRMGVPVVLLPLLSPYRPLKSAETPSPRRGMKRPTKRKAKA